MIEKQSYQQIEKTGIKWGKHLAEKLKIPLSVSITFDLSTPYYKQKEITNRFISEMLSLFSVSFQVRVKKLAMLAVIGLPVRAIIA